MDLMVPQRTLLGGWCMVIPCFYLLYTAFDPRKRASMGQQLPGAMLETRRDGLGEPGRWLFWAYGPGDCR